MSDAQATAQPGEKRPGKKKKLVWILICVVSILAGALIPLGLGASKLFSSSNATKKAEEEAEQVSVPFGDVAVNLSENRMLRYLRVKIVLQVSVLDEKEFTKRLDKRKPAMKDWLISHLSGKTLKDVGGTASVKRIQREIQDRFEEMLYPEGDGKPFEVLFEEFVVQ
jgi:flagellar basal body-associated protein FliL